MDYEKRIRTCMGDIFHFNDYSPSRITVRRQGDSMSLEVIGLTASILSGFIWIAVIFSGKRGKKIEQIIKEQKERNKNNA